MTKLRNLFFILLLMTSLISEGFSIEINTEKSSFVLMEIENSQQISVKGVVKDAVTGELLPGVTVVLKGTTTGTTTDIDGNFMINIGEKQATLVFSFIGYTTQEMQVESGSTIIISLQTDVIKLEDVVVVGYGIQKKESVVGAITQATGDDLMTNMRGADLTNALTGTLPGVITVQSNGIPGGSGTDNPATQIFIRGQKTWNNSQPLILVDGIEREMNDVDPYTIKSISVLKDASATAVFGVKGANGVILITTNRGVEGRPKLSLNMSTTGKTVSRIATPLGSYDALQLRNYAIINQVAYSPSTWQYMVPTQLLEFYRDQTYPDYLPDVNWQEESLKKYTFDKNVNLSISGGTKFVKYFGALSYINEGDILNIKDYGQGYSPNFEYNRVNFRSNLDFKVTKTTIFSVNLSGFSSVQQRPRQGLVDEEWFSLYRYPPDIIPVVYSDGVWGEYNLDERFSNRLIDANFTGYSQTKTTEVNTDFQLLQELDFITKGLSAKAKLSYDIRGITDGPNLVDNGIQAKYIAKEIMNEIEPGMTQDEIKAIEAKYTTWLYPPNYANPSGFDFVANPYTYSAEVAQPNRVFRSLNYELSLNYNREFKKHNVGGLFLMSRNERATGSIFPNYREDWVGRATYSYDNRYLLEFNGAYNGSEKFAKENRFGFFPSMAVGWVVSKESFFEPVTYIINNLKLRFSNGKVGSDAGIERWLYEGSWIVTNQTAKFGSPYEQASIYEQRREGVIPNPDIQWETAEKSNIGIETSFFNDMFKVIFDYYWEDRTNIFVSANQRVFPDYFGAPPVAGNIGHVKTSGWEIETDFTKTLSGGLRLLAGLSWAYSNDLVIEKSDPELAPDYQKEAGYPIGQPRKLVPSSIISNWNDIYSGVLEQSNSFMLPGQARYIDYNSDGFINQDDIIPYGYPSRPQFTYMPKIGFEYKGWSLNVNFYGAYNLQEQNVELTMGPFQFDKSLVWQFHKDLAWSPELGNTDNAIIPALRFATDGRKQFYYVSRGQFRLKAANLAYTVKGKVAKSMGLSGMRLYLNGENLFLWSDMLTDADSDAAASRGYPIQKRLTFGINVNF